MSDDGRTPQYIFDRYNDEFHFTVDAAANEDNALCRGFFTKELDGLAQRWQYQTVWCNPPYSNVAPWIAKAAAEQAVNSVTTVMLLRVVTDTRAFHRYIWDEKTNHPRTGVEVRFLSGRIKFLDENGVEGEAPPGGNMVVIFRG